MARLRYTATQVQSAVVKDSITWYKHSCQEPCLLFPEQSCPLQIGFIYLPRHVAKDGYTMDPKCCNLPHPRHTRKWLELLSPRAESFGERIGWAHLRSLIHPGTILCGQEKGRGLVLPNGCPDPHCRKRVVLKKWGLLGTLQDEDSSWCNYIMSRLLSLKAS